MIKQFFLFNLEEYRLILANSACGLIGLVSGDIPRDFAGYMHGLQHGLQHGLLCSTKVQTIKIVCLCTKDKNAKYKRTHRASTDKQHGALALGRGFRLAHFATNKLTFK